MDEPEVICVYCSCPDVQSAEQLAEQLVLNHLAACVQVLPGITSYYRWEEELRRSVEALLMIKCVVASWPDLEAFVLNAHPYDKPELIAVPVEHGSAEYLDWVAGACAPPKDDRH